MIDEITENLLDENEKTMDSLKKNLSKIRTGRAHVGILDGIRVDAYGTKQPLNQVASLSTPDPRQIMVKPWDKSVISDIERAILQAGLGITPTVDGESIRLPIPPLNTERRRDLVKVVGRAQEDAKISIRNHRREANEMIKEGEKDGDITEDASHRGLENVQKITNDYVNRIDTRCAEKEKDVMDD